MRQQQYPEENTAPEVVTREQVLEHMSTLTRPATIRQMAHGMDLKHDGRRYLPRVIQKLTKAKEIEQLHGGRYRLKGQKFAERENAGKSAAREAAKAERPAAPSKQARDPNLVSGRIVAHRDGYGFLVADTPMPKIDGDLFIGRDGLNDAMHGDRVLARVERRRADGRAEGRVVQIVHRENPAVVGLFRYGAHGNHVLPYDTRIHHEIFIAQGDELTPELREKLGADGGAPAASRRLKLPELDGAVVNVQITRFPKGGLTPAGRVVEILGRPGEIGVDVEIVLRKHHIPHVFPEEVLAEARAVPEKAAESELAGRRDFRDLPIVTIDGETARDFDDAVYVRELPGGHYELQVHIADVAHYVRRGTPLDREARLRGTSVYFPNRAVPMLPEELSNGICSLKPNVDRLVMSAIMEMDADGKMVAAEFTPGVIRSAERMTYTNVHKVLEGDAAMNERYAGLAQGFGLMKKLALLLNGQRVKRGSIDFDLPEAVIEFDEQGRMLSVGRSVRNIAHRLIEEFMLAANEAVAEYLEKRGVASLHRVHEKPDPKKVLEFEELAQAFGYSLGVEDLAERRVMVRHGKVQNPARRGRMRPMSVSVPAEEEVDIRPWHYERLTEKIAGKPEERILSYLMLRSLKQARYAADVLGHFALATQEYTHFTSPIRRYPDLIVHRALQWALENPEAVPSARPLDEKDRPMATLGPYSRVELQEIASQSSEAERRADGAERELMDWKTAQFMEAHLGEEYEALIISVQKFGFFVELVEIFVEGLVSIDRLEEVTGQRCVYRDRDHTIVTESHGRSRKSEPRRIFRLGESVRVRAERIDPFRHRVEFSLVAETMAGKKPKE